MVANAVAAAAGAPPPPPPPGGGRGGRGGGRGGRPGRGGKGPNKKRKRHANRRGRPLHAMERMQIMSIWYQLSISARRSLWEALGEMLGETLAGGPDGPAVAQEQPQTSTRRERVWEREILRDVPLFAEFGQMTSRQRREDTRQVPQLLSIAQGVVARGLRQSQSHSSIANAISGLLDNPTELRSLYGEGPAVENESGSGSVSSSDGNGETQEPMKE